MQIFALLIILAALVLVMLAGIFIASLLLGGMLFASQHGRLIAPVFLVVVPASAVGALVGGVLVGYFAARANDSLVFAGSFGGLVLGGAAGLSAGTAGALFWWWRLSRGRKDVHLTGG